MYLAYHHTVRNSKGDSRLTTYEIVETENEAIEFLFSEWSKDHGYEMEIDKCKEGFIDIFRLVGNRPIWQWEFIRKGNGDLYGYHKIDDTKKFSIDLQELRGAAALLEWEEDSPKIIEDLSNCGD